MLSPLSLLGHLVEAFNSIPDLSQECAVIAYDDAGGQRSVAEAVEAMPDPSMLMAHMATELGERGEFAAWKHQFSIFIRPIDDAQGYRIFRALVDGQASNWPVAAQYMRIHEDCDPMEAISFNRVANDDGIEYFTFSFTLTEIGG